MIRLIRSVPTDYRQQLELNGRLKEKTLARTRDFGTRERGGRV